MTTTKEIITHQSDDPIKIDPPSESDILGHIHIHKDKTIQRILNYIGYLRNNHSYAARNLLSFESGSPLNLWWGQDIMLDEMQRRKILFIVAGRGCTKTSTAAISHTLKALLYPRLRVALVGPSFRQTKFAFAEIVRMYENSPALKAAAKKPPTFGTDSCKFELKNGSIIAALPLGDGEKIRGFRAHVLGVDEVVKINEQILEVSVMPMLNVNKDPMKEVERRELLEIRKSLIDRGVITKDDFPESYFGNDLGNQVIFTTTAWFQFAPIYKKMQLYLAMAKESIKRGEEPWVNVLNFTHLDPPDGFLDRQMIELNRQTMSPIYFAIENCCFWPKDTDGFYPASIVMACRGSYYPILAAKRDKSYLLLVDPAREQDNFIITVVELGSPNKVVFINKMNRSDFEGRDGFKVMADKIRFYRRCFRPERIIIDAGGGGLAVRDRLSVAQSYVNSMTGEVLEDPALLQINGQNEFHDAIFKKEQDGNFIQIIDMVNFSTEWINPNAIELRSLLESKNLTFATYINNPKIESENISVVRDRDVKRNIEIDSDPRDLIAEEIEKAMEECTWIVVEPLPQKKGYFRFLTSKKDQTKDRWATLVMAAYGITNIGKNRRLTIDEDGNSTEEIEFIDMDSSRSRGLESDDDDSVIDGDDYLGYSLSAALS